MTELEQPHIQSPAASASEQTARRIQPCHTAVCVSCHRRRDVWRVSLGDGVAFLKRQFEVRWKERLASWWSGFGLVSRSLREWSVLHALRAAGFDCPEPLAVEEKHGGARLLVNALPDSIDLPTFLGYENLSGEFGRIALARTIGETLARFHAAGFDHPDLYAKHVFINLAEGTVAFVDYQRTQLRRRVSWRERWRDLAALDASLGERLANARERIACLAAYVRAAAPKEWKRRFRQGLWAIMKRSAYLLRKPRIRKMRESPAPPPERILYQRVAIKA